MSLIRLAELKSSLRSRQFQQICTIVSVLITVLLLLAYGFLTIQRIASLKEKMNDGADLLALRVQDRLSSVQGTSMYLASLQNVNTLLVQEHPSLSTFSDYDDVLCSMAGSDLSIELLFHKSEKILISDYGLSCYQTYYDQAFLDGLLKNGKKPEHWELRSYQQNIYTEPKAVLSYIRSLPLSSVKNTGYIIVSHSLSSLAKIADIHADPQLGDYAVWLEDGMLLASSTSTKPDERAQLCLSKVETSARAAYWMPFGVMLRRSLPSPVMSLGIWVLAMVLCAGVALAISRQRMVKLDMLVQEMGGEWRLEEGYEDQVDQLYRIFESLTLELAHARQTTREGMPFLRERLIGELLRTPVPVDKLRQSLDHCGIGLKQPYFAVVQAELEEKTPDGQMDLLVRRNVQTQLAELGEVYSTYGDGSSILFLVNTSEYASLSEKLEKLCETMHDALQRFLAVNVVFSIGLCTENTPHPHEAYIAARDQLSTLRKLDEQPQEAVVLAHPGRTVHLHSEMVQQVADAVIAQDEAALEVACDSVNARYMTAELSLRETLRRAMVLMMRTWAALAEAEFLLSADALNAVIRQLQQKKTAEEVRTAVGEWCRSLISRGAEADSEGNHYVEEALRFIHEHYMCSLSVPEIGEAVNVNPIYLNRLFKSTTGNTLSNYLNQYRCEHARAMLDQTQATVSEISDACGFSEVRSFIRFFKKYYEETPTEYRKRTRG